MQLVSKAYGRIITKLTVMFLLTTDYKCNVRLQTLTVLVGWQEEYLATQPP